MRQSLGKNDTTVGGRSMSQAHAAVESIDREIAATLASETL